MNKQLTQKQKVIIITGYCILVLVLSVVFIANRKSPEIGVRPTEDVTEYIDVIGEDINTGKLEGSVLFLSNAISEIPINLPIYRTGESRELKLAQTFGAKPTKTYEYYKEYETEEWVIVEEVDSSKYTIGSKIHKAESEASPNFSEQILQDLAKDFAKNQLQINVDFEQLECSVKKRLKDYQFSCQKKINDYPIIIDFDNLTPIVININTDNQVYFAQISYLEAISTSTVDSVSLLTKEDIKKISVDEINEHGRFSMISDVDMNPSATGDHAHPTEITGKIKSTKIDSVDLAYQKKSGAKNTLLIPLFIFSGEAMTSQDEKVYITILYPATNLVQAIKE